MTELTRCPNCDTKIRKGSIFEVHMMGEEALKKINDYQGTNLEACCAKCGGSLLEKAENALITQKKDLDSDIQNRLHLIPVVTVFNPSDWEFEVIEMVTGQSTIGTGFITEVASSFTDFLGMESQRHNEKIRLAEDIAKAQARMRCVELGGNAIVGANMNYSEIGGLKGMIMVAMTGTAVKLKNLESVFSKERAAATELLIDSMKKMMNLPSYD